VRPGRPFKQLSDSVEPLEAVLILDKIKRSRYWFETANEVVAGQIATLWQRLKSQNAKSQQPIL